MRSPTCARISLVCPCAMFNDVYRPALNVLSRLIFPGLWTISTKTWLRVRIETRDHSKISERPPAWSASATTVPLACFGSRGRLMMMRVV